MEAGRYYLQMLFIVISVYLYRKTGVEWESKLLANYHPSYYGMMVATFLPHQNHRTQDTEL